MGVPEGWGILGFLYLRPPGSEGGEEPDGEGQGATGTLILGWPCRLSQPLSAWVAGTRRKWTVARASCIKARDNGLEESAQLAALHLAALGG